MKLRCTDNSTRCIQVFPFWAQFFCILTSNSVFLLIKVFILLHNSQKIFTLWLSLTIIPQEVQIYFYHTSPAKSFTGNTATCQVTQTQDGNLGHKEFIYASNTFLETVLQLGNSEIFLLTHGEWKQQLRFEMACIWTTGFASRVGLFAMVL